MCFYRLSFACTLLFYAQAAAAFNVSAHIESPVNGSIVSKHFSSRFSSTCPGERNTVKWYLDGLIIGSASFIDTAGIHISRPLPEGRHSLKVVSSCGYETVQFQVRNAS